MALSTTPLYHRQSSFEWIQTITSYSLNYFPPQTEKFSGAVPELSLESSPSPVSSAVESEPAQEEHENMKNLLIANDDNKLLRRSRAVRSKRAQHCESRFKSYQFKPVTDSPPAAAPQPFCGIYFSLSFSITALKIFISRSTFV